MNDDTLKMIFEKFLENKMEMFIILKGTVGLAYVKENYFSTYGKNICRKS